MLTFERIDHICVQLLFISGVPLSRTHRSLAHWTCESFSIYGRAPHFIWLRGTPTHVNVHSRLLELSQVLCLAHAPQLKSLRSSKEWYPAQGEHLYQLQQTLGFIVALT